jgi:hypothetical protein
MALERIGLIAHGDDHALRRFARLVGVDLAVSPMLVPERPSGLA